MKASVKQFMSRCLSVLLSVVLIVAFIPSAGIPSVAYAKGTVEDSTYTGLAVVGDSISMGYGPMMFDNTWEDYYFSNSREGSYPALLRDDLNLDDMNSLSCVGNRVQDVYYILGGEMPDVTNHYPSKIVDEEGNPKETATWAEDAEAYEGTTFKNKVQAMAESGDAITRIENSDLILMNIGMADVMYYPSTYIDIDDDVTTNLELIADAISTYMTYYEKTVKRIQEINPDATIAVLSMYDPFGKLQATGTEDQMLLAAFRQAVTTMNTYLSSFAALNDKIIYVDVSGLSQYVDSTTTVVAEGELINAIGNHENHFGASGNQYAEDQILATLGYQRGTLEPSTDETTSYLAFSSDTHVSDNGYSVKRLDTWLDEVSAEQGTDGETQITFDYLGLCGDLAAATSGWYSATYGNKIQYMMNIVDQNTHVADAIYTTGNHEWSPGLMATQSDLAPYSNITRLGEAADTDKYQIYCFGAAQYSQTFTEDDIAALANYLENEADNSKPVFVMSHFPLHSYTNSDESRTSGNAQEVIDVLNNYPNVVFLWGHNHTMSDPHYGKVYTGDVDGTAINFIYCAAGCMSDEDYSTGSGNTEAKGLVAAIDGDSDFKLTYYNEDAEVLSSYEVNINSGTAEQLYPEVEPNFDDNTYTAASTITDGDYVIAVNDTAMNNAHHDGYVTINNNITYTYTGLAGNAITVKSDKVTAGITENDIWTVQNVAGGFTLQDADGKYLTGTYTSGAGASIQLEDTPDTNGIWTYTTDGYIKNVGTGKYLNYELDGDVDGELQSGETSLFTLRSGANDTAKFYSAATGDPITSDYEATTSLEDGAWYVITAEGQSLISSENSGYTNSNYGSTYSYSGLNGKVVTAENGYITSTVTDEMLWKAVSVDGGWQFVNKDGKYLNASYEKNVSGFTGVGKLYVSDTPQTWSFSGTSLLNASCGKYLNWQNEDDIDGSQLTGNSLFFTVRSSSKDAVTIYRAANEDGQSAKATEVTDAQFNQVHGETVASYNLMKSGTIADGAQIVIATNRGDGYSLSSEANVGYIMQNGTSYYQYSGLSASPLPEGVTAGTTAVIATDDVSATNVWTVHATDTSGKYYLTNSEGKYLSSTYTSGDTITFEDGTTQTAKGKGTLTLLDEPDSTSMWGIAFSSAGMLRLTNTATKYLQYNWSGTFSTSETFLEPGTIDDVSVFTVRSSSYPDAYAYVYTESETSPIASGKQYVIVAPEGYAVSSNTGTGYNDADSSYRYDGMDAINVNIADEKITSAVTEDMVWTITQVEEGYYIQSASGKYLCSSYDESTVIHTYLSDTPEVWTYSLGKLVGSASTKQLAYQTNGGTASVFTLRSSVGQEMEFYELSTTTSTKTALYVTAAGGSVSLSRECVSATDGKFVGSTATAKSGYHFVCWVNNTTGETVSKDATFVPTEPGVYQAVFEEETFSISYTAKLIGNHGSLDDLADALSATNENLGVVTGTPKGTSVTTPEGYNFLYWTSDALGTRIISKSKAFIPAPSGNDDETYYAWFDKQTVCSETETTQLNTPVAGIHTLVVNGTDCGKFVFTEVEDGWTIYSVDNNKFVSLSDDNALKYSNVAFTWTWGTGGFQVKRATTIWIIVPITTYQTYYLTTANDALASSTTAPKSIYLQDSEVVNYYEHLIGSYVSLDDATHAGICSRCGAQAVVEDHTTDFKDNGNGTHTEFCTICNWQTTAQHTPSSAVIENEVAATCTTEGSYDEVVYCSDCGAEISRVTTKTPALGHEWSEWVVTKEATATEPGIETRTCARDASHVQTRETAKVESVKVYRLYNPSTSEHLWTTDYSEYVYLATVGWNQENVAWLSPTTSTVGVYRLYNSGLATHHYTASKAEADQLVSEYGWAYDNNEQPMFYSAATLDASGKQVAMPGATATYRLYNSSLSQHHYTQSKAENDNLVAQFGWTNEDVGFYAWAV